MTGIHIRSRTVVPDDSKAVWTSVITPEVVPWMSKVLLNAISSYDVVKYSSMYLSSDHFSSPWNFQNPKQTQLMHRTMCLRRATSSVCLKSVKTHETTGNHVRATQILPGQLYHQAYLPG